MSNDLKVQIKQTHTLSQQTLLTLNVLQMDAQALAEYARDCYESNPALEQISPAVCNTSTSRFAGRTAPGARRSKANSNDTDAFQQIEQTITIADYIINNIDYIALDPETTRIAKLLAQLVEDDGYIRSDLDRFALNTHSDPIKVERALEALQSLDPPGICARNLAECLVLQLKRRGEANHILLLMAENHLDDIAGKRFDVIARELGISVKRVRECVDELRKLNPRPCPNEISGRIEYIIPDISVLPGSNGSLEIVYYDDYYPSFRVDPSYASLSRSVAAEDRKYIQHTIQSANQLVRAMEMRRHTLERVINLIAVSQYEYLTTGDALRPLRYKDIAKTMGVHESTIYRAVNGKHILCVTGVKPLSDFFQRDVAGGGSVDEACQMIRVVLEEYPGISDQGIARIMLDRGLPLARRTITKYRSKMGITTSYQRSQS